MFVTGFVAFVLTLDMKNLKYQFIQLGYSYVTLMVVIGQSSMFIHNIFEGMVWFLLPAILVVCNDSLAYVWGMLFGKHSLISISPNKTWEGFIGAFFSTLAFAFVVRPCNSVAFSLLVCVGARAIPLLHLPKN